MDHPRLPCLSTTRDKLLSVAGLDTLSAKQLGHIVAPDAALCTALVHKACTLRHRHLANPVTTLRQTVQMLGMQGVLREATALPTVEDSLPEAHQEPYTRQLAQSALAGLMGLHIGYERHELEPGEMALAALLHDMGRLAQWVNQGPQMDMLTFLDAAGGMPAGENEFVIFGQSIDCTSHELATRWSMPELVVHGLETGSTDNPRAAGARIANRLASQAVNQWQLEGLEDDLGRAADYLARDPLALVAFVDSIIEKFNSHIEHYKIDPVLPLDDRQPHAAPAGFEATYCLCPRGDHVKSAVLALRQERFEHPDNVVRTLATGLHAGLALDRVLFFKHVKNDEKSLAVEPSSGTRYDPQFNSLRLILDSPHFFSRLMSKPQIYQVNAVKNPAAWALVPEHIRESIRTNQFLAASLFVDGSPYGMIYADRRHASCQIDERAYAQFKALCLLASQSLKRAWKATRPARR